MIQLKLFKNTKENVYNRSKITKIGVLEAVDNFFAGKGTLTEKELCAIIESNLTQIGVKIENVELGDNDVQTPVEPEPTQTPVEPEPTQTPIEPEPVQTPVELEPELPETANE